jgi:hypothetical protein
MSSLLEVDEALAAAVAGIPRVAEVIAAIPPEDRLRALNAAEKSYLQTAQALGYEGAGADQWATTVMSRLRNLRESKSKRE